MNLDKPFERSNEAYESAKEFMRKNDGKFQLGPSGSGERSVWEARLAGNFEAVTGHGETEAAAERDALLNLAERIYQTETANAEMPEVPSPS